jgi:hypothetical protein
MTLPIDWVPLPASDRLRLLTEELRYGGPQRWILSALDFLADELEEAASAAREPALPRGGPSNSQ